MQTIIYISGIIFLATLASICLIIIHKVLLGTIIYRWVVNSILYPFRVKMIREMVQKMKGTDKDILRDQIEVIRKWRRDYWFGKRLKKILITELEKIE